MPTGTDWYSQLGRVLDLVGDCAGRELFLLDGDSLVLQCLDDRKLDFHDGFQLLQAVWNVERFLSKLLAARCSFCIVFFDENSTLVASAASDRRHSPKYNLAREIIFLHLKAYLGRAHPQVEVWSFKSIESSEFQAFLRGVSAYFVMCHNGAQLAHSGDSQISLKSSWALVISRFMSHGFNVALINEIEWRDYKVITRVLEASIGLPQFSESMERPHACRNIDFGKTTPKDVTICTQLIGRLNASEKAADLSLTPRERLSLIALSAYILQDSGKLTNTFAIALVLQLALLRSLSLSQRKIPLVRICSVEQDAAYNDFLGGFSKAASDLLRASVWDLSGQDNMDLHDLIDGRLLRGCLSVIADDYISFLDGKTKERFKALSECLDSLTERSVGRDRLHQILQTERIDSPYVVLERRKLLPFEHSVFDEHLADIYVDIEVEPTNAKSTPAIIAQEKTHWHTRKPLITKGIIKSNKPLTKWHNPERLFQIQMQDMTKYAASLANANGNALTPKRVFCAGPTPSGPHKDSYKVVQEKQGSGKKRNIIEENEEKKVKKMEAKLLDAWNHKVCSVEKMTQSDQQVKETVAYLNKLDGSGRDLLEPEIRVYILKLLILQWQKANASMQIPYAAAIWDQVRILRTLSHGMTEDCRCLLENINSKLGLPALPNLTSTLPKRPLSFPFNLHLLKSGRLSRDLSLHEFQLIHCGPYMERNMNSSPDARVDFEPDEWQRKVLDHLDAKHSVFVVAPTSAGKTFISFYAMEQILREDNEGVLIYVAPTKALVNQIAAEIHARFTKDYQGRKTVWAIHTRDTRINTPTNCQILVTVPHILQIMLLSPANATTWALRVRCIIFDEIHCIGQVDDGLVWEQLLLLAPCRIIALSATVGNPTEFTNWLSSTQESLGISLEMIRHNHRHSDLRKFIYYPQKEFAFNGLLQTASGETMLESGIVPGLSYIHPIASLVERARTMPEDLSLEPRDCYILWRSMIKHGSSRFPVPEELDPHQALPSFIRKADVYEWGHRLKEFLSGWIQNPDSPFEKVWSDLRNTKIVDSLETNGHRLNIEGPDRLNARPNSKQELCESVFPLLVELHQQNALPALLFNYERLTCEKIAETILLKMKHEEDNYKKSPTWQEKLKAHKNQQSTLQKSERKAASNRKTKKRGDSHEFQSKEDSIRDAAEQYDNIKTFDPEALLDSFSFADIRKLTRAELEKERQYLHAGTVNSVLLEALERGIGVHHSGLSRRYRVMVERLFRKGFLRVVIATGTLALGINMPCPTVVFCGDSVYLTALNFRQAAGRAGRRGFDLLGNVIFHGIPLEKAYQLMSSRLPDLIGHFPITTSLVLRLFILLHHSDKSPYAVRVVNTLLSQARLCLGGEESKASVLHHLRFSIEYLRRQCLLGPKGEPCDFASVILHLYNTEKSSFAFHALLRAGYFSRLCQLYKSNRDQLMRTMMIVLSHLFGRQSLGSRYQDLLQQRCIMKWHSVVMLPEVPNDAVEVIRSHNKEALKTFSSYVKTFVERNLKGPEQELPLTGIRIGGNGNAELSKLLGSMEPNVARSAFVGLSGHGDDFDSVGDLCRTVRSGVFLEQSVIPHLDIYPDDLAAPLNAYLYDFFCHGSQDQLEVANQIGRSDSWFLLNDFSLTLATIVTGLQNYLDPETTNTFDAILAAGIGDETYSRADEADIQATNDSDLCEPSFPSESCGKASVPSYADQRAAFHRQKNHVSDSWEEEDSEEEETDHEDILFDDALRSKQVQDIDVVLQAFSELKERFDEQFYKTFA